MKQGRKVFTCKLITMLAAAILFAVLPVTVRGAITVPTGVSGVATVSDSGTGDYLITATSDCTVILNDGDGSPTLYFYAAAGVPDSVSSISSIIVGEHVTLIQSGSSTMYFPITNKGGNVTINGKLQGELDNLLSGGTVTIGTTGQVSGNVNNLGTFINQNILVTTAYGGISNEGSFTNAGEITLQPNNTCDNSGTFTNSGQIMLGINAGFQAHKEIVNTGLIYADPSQTSFTIEPSDWLTTDSTSKFTNNGTLRAPTIILEQDNRFVSGSNAVYQISVLFEKNSSSTFDLTGTVEVLYNDNTSSYYDPTVKAGDGTFYLVRGAQHRTRTVAGGTPISKTASQWLVKDPIDIQFIGISTSYYMGVDPKFEEHVAVPYDYSQDEGSSVTITYSNSIAGSYTSQFPIGTGNFYVKASAAGTANYGAAEVVKSFTIEYLPLDEVPTFSLTGFCLDVTSSDYRDHGATIGAGKYFAKKSITVNAPTGFEVKTNNGITAYADNVFAPSILLNEINTSKDDSFNSDLGFYFRRMSDGAETDSYGYAYHSKILPTLPYFIYDETKPSISAKADGRAVTLTDGAVVEAAQLDVIVSDTYLQLAKSDTEHASRDDGTLSYDSSTAVCNTDPSFTYKVNPGETKNCHLYAIDLSGNIVDITFRLKYQKKANLSLTQGNVYAGVSYKTQCSTDSDGKVTLTYKKADAADSYYTEVVPNQPGKYTVRASVPATSKYEAAVKTVTYTISYLAAPDKPYTVSGTKGSGGFYKSTVYLVAPDGYGIATELFGSYDEKVAYNSDLKSVYLKRTSDGALTDAIKITETFKIDKTKPKIKKATNQKGDELTIEDGDEIYADEVSIKISDTNLKSVTLDDEKIEFSGKSATLVLEPKKGRKKYDIVAKDKAGNKLELSITVISSWQKKGIVPSGKKLTLQKGRKYKLDSGSKWKISGDDTTYNGGMAIYVKKAGDYTFTKE